MKDSPAYIQLYEEIRELIGSGEYASGSRLPSKRNCAFDHGLSLVTVEHAYAILLEEGYIESRERSGYYVVDPSEDPYRSFLPSKTESPLEGNLLLPEDTFPFSVYAKTVRKVLSRYGEKIFEKCPSSGSRILRSAIASYLHRTRGMAVSPEAIVIGSGSEYLYGLLAQTVPVGLVVAIESPSYEKIQQVYQSYRIPIQPLPLGRDGISTAALDTCTAKYLHVTPFHSYPSGISASFAKRKEYLAWAKKNHAHLIEDDFDSEFTLLSKPVDTLFAMEPEHTVYYLNTFTKTIAPSMRVGYLVLPSQEAETFQAKISGNSCSVPVLTQLVIAELLNDGSFERQINRVRRKRRKESSGALNH